MTKSSYTKKLQTGSNYTYTIDKILTNVKRKNIDHARDYKMKIK